MLCQYAMHVVPHVSHEILASTDSTRLPYCPQLQTPPRPPPPLPGVLVHFLVLRLRGLFFCQIFFRPASGTLGPQPGWGWGGFWWFSLGFSDPSQAKSNAPVECLPPSGPTIPHPAPPQTRAIHTAGGSDPQYTMTFRLSDFELPSDQVHTAETCRTHTHTYAHTQLKHAAFPDYIWVVLT